MKIVAIGGGEIGRPGYKIETETIDKEIIKLSGKKHPRVLFIPTASGDSKSYYSVVQDYYGKRLGCKTDVLYLLESSYSVQEMREKVLGSDIIYVGGGNTLKMLKLWRKKGLDSILQEALEKDLILSGVSAGAICWFEKANSDSLKFQNKNSSLIRVTGLGFLPNMCCPHYSVEKERKPSLRKMIKKYGGISIALDNCSAIEVIDDKYRIITSSRQANAYKVFRENGRVIEEPLPKDGDFRSLKDLD
jgi:dipeptidase E